MNTKVNGFLGIDVGTTSMKASVFTETGVVIGQAARATKWQIGPNGLAQAQARQLVEDAVTVMVEAVEDVSDPIEIMGIGITGMAETGVLLDSGSQPITPAIAWFDERGKDELDLLPPEFQLAFSAHTGLAYKAECSFSKLLWRHEKGEHIPRGAIWLNLLEYIAFNLTGEQATEPSLASRTGLWDQQRNAPWSPVFEYIGGVESLLPPMVNAGQSIGRVSQIGPELLRGAEVTVAGHDHLVGAVGAGAFGPDDLYNSCGTADVLLRSVSRPLSNLERTTLVSRGLSAGRHVLPSATAILGATRSGLVLGRVLAMLGISSREARRRFADEWTPHRPVPTQVCVTEPPNWTNEVSVSLRDDCSPSEIWDAAMAYTLSGTSDLISAVEDIASRYSLAVAAGGWAQLDGVFLGKSQVMPGLTRCATDQPGIRGAAIFAALAAGESDLILTAAIAASVVTPPKKEFIS